MSNKFEPIQTYYKGYKFRSRTEARWAIAFDALGLKWEYEKEGFSLGELGCYLPDFWVPYEFGPGWGCWVEIKPEAPTFEEAAKLAALTELTGHRSYCVCGSPWDGEHQVYVFQHHHSGRPKNIPLIAGGKLIESTLYAGDLAYETSIDVRHGETIFPFAQNKGGFEKLRPGILYEAFKAARSARFEHGETPNP